MPERNPYLALAADGIGGLAPYEPGLPPEQLEREYGISGAVKLASNENPLPLPGPVMGAMKAALKDVPRYPDGAGFKLRSALAQHLGVRSDQLTLGNGSNDVLVLLAETFLTPDTSAVYDQYSFVVYRLAVQAVNAAARVAQSFPQGHSRELGHDLDAMLAQVDATTRMVFVANPNNPTGTWLDGDELRSFITALPEHVIVVLDEAYYEYAIGPGYPETLAWLDDFPNLVIVRTFSKVYGLAALRVGYGISSPGIAELLNRVRQPFNVNSIGQAAAVAALAEQSWVDDCRMHNARGLARMQTELSKLGIESVPSRGNFLLAKLGPDASACNEFLLREGVIVRPVANYGLPGYLRMTVGSHGDMERLLTALQAYKQSGT
jgi:histidinol-phosphate aminotransferase